MKRQEIFEKVQAIVAEHLEVAQEKVDWDFPLFEATRVQEAKQTNDNTHYPSFLRFFFGSCSTPVYSSKLLDDIELVMALEEKFDIEIPDEDIEKNTTIQHVVNYVSHKLPELENEKNGESVSNWIENLNKKLASIKKESLTSGFGEFLSSLIETLQISRNKKFVFLLLGRTGVGKSSTINTLMGKEVAPTSRRKPTAMDVNFHESEINNIHFTVVDTPGLCDKLPEKGNDQKYLERISLKVKQIDVLWFVTPLYKTRIRSDELNGIRIISEAFGPEIWKHAVIMFTFANKADDYLVDLKERTEDIQEAIAKYAVNEVASNIPSVAVDNKSETTPDGNKWLGELYTKVFVKMSEKGIVPFLLATVKKINAVRREPNWRFYQKHEPAQEGYTQQEVEFNEQQKEEIKEKLFSVVPIFKTVGKKIGSVFGEVGTFVGEVAGTIVGETVDDVIASAIKFISWLF